MTFLQKIALLFFSLGVAYLASKLLMDPISAPQQLQTLCSLEDVPVVICQEFGLKELYPGRNPVVDIVAIHGLDGHREKSWTDKNGVLWLRDLLPVAVPHARILTYGYDAYTRDREQLTDQSLYDHAQQLITQLSTERRRDSTDERPIIFIAHSLGGNVLKYALIHANSAHKDHNRQHRAISLSTYGILFLGTPHQGTDSADFGLILLQIKSIFSPTNDAVLRDLPRDSKAMQQQLSQFAPISSMFETKFFFEAYPTTLVGGLSKVMIVPKASAVLPGAVNTEAIALWKDHIGLAKFGNLEDGDFKTISSHLVIMMRNAAQKIAERWNRYRINDEMELGPIWDLKRLDSMRRDGETLLNQGRFKDAEKLFTELIKACEKNLGPDDPMTVSSILCLGKAFFGQGRMDEAETRFRQVLETRERILGLSHRSTISSVDLLYQVLTRLGRNDEASTLLNYYQNNWVWALTNGFGT